MDRVALIDGDFIMFYCGFGKKVLDEDKNPIKKGNKFVYEDKTWEEVKDSVDSLLNVILKRLKVKWYAGYLTEGRGFRYQIYPDYKGNRRKLEKPKWFSEIKQYLIEYYGFTRCNCLEADDAVNIYKNRLKDKYRCIIVSPDKDILSLEGTHFDPKNMKWIETDKDSANYKFWEDMIVGQPGDNIKGIPGKGEKFAKEYFDFWVPKLLSYEQIVIECYCKSLGQEKGIFEFYKNYRCLKILDESELLPDPVLIEYNKEKQEDIYV